MYSGTWRKVILVVPHKLKITVRSLFLQVKIPRRSVDVESSEDAAGAGTQSVEYIFSEIYVKNYCFFSFIKLEREFILCVLHAYLLFLCRRPTGERIGNSVPHRVHLS